jgi:hypothetical protein
VSHLYASNWVAMGVNRVLLSALLALVMACDRTIVREYEAPKEALAQNAAFRDQRDSTHSPGDTSVLELKAPPHWQRQAPAPMRKASFVVAGADGAKVDISVSSFHGESGGILANINRWREQLGLDAIAPAHLESILERQTFAGRDFVIVDFINDQSGTKNRQRIIGAIVVAANETWFFKMTGDEALTAGEKSAFLEVLKSAQFRGQ